MGAADWEVVAMGQWPDFFVGSNVKKYVKVMSHKSFSLGGCMHTISCTVTELPSHLGFECPILYA